MLGSVLGHHSLENDNPSLQIHSLGENLRKSYLTFDATNGLFSAVLMRQDQHVAVYSYLPWNEAYKHSSTLSSLLLLMPCWDGKPNG
jgi:hypothetical protein